MAARAVPAIMEMALLPEASVLLALRWIELIDREICGLYSVMSCGLGWESSSVFN